MDLAQLVIAIFLLLLSGSCAFVMGRLMKLSDAHAETQGTLRVAIAEIKHLQNKAATHTNHIDTLFEMKTQVAAIEAQMKQLADTLPQAMHLMSQLASIALKKAA